MPSLRIPRLLINAARRLPSQTHHLCLGVVSKPAMYPEFPVFPFIAGEFTKNLAPASFMVILVASLCVSAGIGGGSLLVATYILVYQQKINPDAVHNAVPLSQAAITGLAYYNEQNLTKLIFVSGSQIWHCCSATDILLPIDPLWIGRFCRS